MNSSTGNIVAIPIQPNGTAGAAYVRATLPFPQGGDEFAIDVHGSIYCTTDPFNTLVRLDPDGTTETLLTATDGLDGPTSAAFGRRGRNRKSLYITNGAFPVFGGVQPQPDAAAVGDPRRAVGPPAGLSRERSRRGLRRKG